LKKGGLMREEKLKNETPIMIILGILLGVFFIQAIWLFFSLRGLDSIFFGIMVLIGLIKLVRN